MPDRNSSRDRKRAWSKKEVRASQEIGPPPAVANPARRAIATWSLRFFLQFYFRDTFCLPWSDDHLLILARIERAANEGGCFALAAPRSTGKTSICRCAALWAVLTGRRRYVAVIAQTHNVAAKILGHVKKLVRFNAALYADFPAELHGFVALAGQPKRCVGQICEGQPTSPEWIADRIVFPTISGSLASGAIISVAGLTGGEIRGQQHVLADGATTIRPDFCLIDDPQTRESAGSVTQTADRLMLLNGDVLQLAGPDRSIAAVCCCTVIQPDDLAQQLLDRKQSPAWMGETLKMVYAFPEGAEAKQLWEEHAEMEEAEATEFYRAHQAEMDRGARVAWPERLVAGDIRGVSGIECAMKFRASKPDVFAAEYQNDPLPPDAGDTRVLTVDEVAHKINRRPRRAVPTGCEHVTAFVDVHKRLLYWMVCAWEPDFTGHVIDYGTTPDQRRRHFAKSAVPRPFPGVDVPAEVYAGLGEIVDDLTQRQWMRDDGTYLQVARLLIDTRWETKLVYRYIKQSGHGNLVWPWKGVGVLSGSRPISQYRRKSGELIGDNWYLPNIKGTREPRHVLGDTNYWKSFVHARLATSMGSPGCLSLWGDNPTDHRLFAEHVAASEYATKTEGWGRVVYQWRERATRPDNDMLDCLVGCAVAASTLGCQLAGAKAAPRPAPRQRRKIQYLD